MEKRTSSRTSLLSECRSQFRMGGQSYNGIQVANLGPRGCCLQMPASTARQLKDKPFLENLILLQGGIRNFAIRGRVAWCEDHAPAKASFVKAGVEFLDAPEACTREISAYVMATTRA
jgi:hypothetical protein